MEIVRRVFDAALVLKRTSRVDRRGVMTVVCDDSIDGFEVKATRVYTMNEAGTFFGIHYRPEGDHLNRLAAVVKGRGMDYLIDLREDSPTYLKWEKIELTDDNLLSVMIPAGIGHAFLSLEDDTIMAYSMDRCGKDASVSVLNHLEEKIGLITDIPVRVIADYDANAPFLRGL